MGGSSPTVMGDEREICEDAAVDLLDMFWQTARKIAIGLALATIADWLLHKFRR